MRQVLAIDCSFGGHSVAVADRTGVRAGCHHPRIVASLGLMASVDRVLRQAATSLDRISLLAFGAGPGLFSGIRAACTAVQGLGFVNDLRVVPVATTTALAQAHCPDNALVAYPAHQGYCYAAALRRAGTGWHELLPPALHARDQLPALAGDWHVCGWRVRELRAGCRQAVAGRLLSCTSHRGSLAGTIAMLALANPAAAVAPDQALPDYVRMKVAYTRDERRAIMQGQ